MGQCVCLCVIEQLFWQHLVKLWLILTQTLTFLSHYLFLNIILSPIITLGMCNVRLFPYFTLHIFVGAPPRTHTVYDEDNSLILYMQTKVCAKGKFPHCWLRSLFLFPTFSWLSESPITWFKNSFCLHTWLPPGKNTTFSTSWESFYSHWNPQI